MKIDTVNYFPTTDTQAALRRLRRRTGHADAAAHRRDTLAASANMPGALHIMPSLALGYIAMNLRDPALADIRVRRALNLVYDREAVTDKVVKLGETPAYGIVPPGIANCKASARAGR